ncbi:MAG: phosphoribosylanthranilate isomerase, partial [Acidobacteriaceae bacterium]
MTWAKICGITNFEDAKTAVDAGADALGFIFYEKSPRNISANAAREIVAKLPGGIENVGVFVEGTGTPKAWFETAAFAGLSSLQIYIGFTGES